VGESGLPIFIMAIKLSWRGIYGRFTVGSLPGVEATLRREFMAFFISQKVLLLVR